MYISQGLGGPKGDAEWHSSMDSRLIFQLSHMFLKGDGDLETASVIGFALTPAFMLGKAVEESS